MTKCKLIQLADMLEAQIRILAGAGLVQEAEGARQEAASLRLLAEVSN